MIILDECELVLLISGLACGIAKCVSDEELSLLASIFVQLGDSLETIATKREICNKKNDT